MSAETYELMGILIESRTWPVDTCHSSNISTYAYVPRTRLSTTGDRSFRV